METVSCRPPAPPTPGVASHCDDWGRQKKSGFRRFVTRTNTRAVARGPRVFLRAGTIYRRMRDFSHDSAARPCAPVEANTFPGRLRHRMFPAPQRLTQQQLAVSIGSMGCQRPHLLRRNPSTSTKRGVVATPAPRRPCERMRNHARTLDASVAATTHNGNWKCRPTLTILTDTRTKFLTRYRLAYRSRRKRLEPPRHYDRQQTTNLSIGGLPLRHAIL